MLFSPRKTGQFIAYDFWLFYSLEPGILTFIDCEPVFGQDLNHTVFGSTRQLTIVYITVANEVFCEDFQD